MFVHFSSLTTCCSLNFKQKENELDSLAWSRKYEVLSISRLVLHDLGLSVEHINSLTDEDMQALADGLQESISKTVGNLLEEVRFMVRLYLAEKEETA